MSHYRKVQYRQHRESVTVAQDEHGAPAGAGFLIVAGGALLFWLFVLLLFSGV